MDEPIISIIVPVYNVEKYLVKCIDSIINQTFKEIEIILVDDGSTDGSGKICDEYKKNDKRVKVIHKKNEGLSSARNTGIDIAKGDYLGFVDSDDYIALDMYEVLYYNIVKEGADLSVCGHFDCYKNQKCCKTKEPYYKVVDVVNAIKLILDGKVVSMSSCTKLYKRKIFETIRYPVGRTFEDAFVIVKVLMQCKIIVITSQQKYYYYHREDSITTRKFSEKGFDVIDAHKINYDIISKNYPEIKNFAMGRVCWANFLVLDRMIASGSSRDYKNSRKEIVKFLKRHFREILCCDIFTYSRKISMAVLMVSFHLYAVLSAYNTKKNLKNNS